MTGGVTDGVTPSVTSHAEARHVLARLSVTGANVIGAILPQSSDAGFNHASRPASPARSATRRSRRR